jgi:hydrogenase/urease accessory protein HupE
MKKLLLMLLGLFATCQPGLLSAHALDPGYLNLDAMGKERWRVTWRIPDVSGRPMPIEARLPETCSHAPPPEPVFDGRAWMTNWVATCPGGLTDGLIEIRGLERTSTDALVRYELEPGKSQVYRLTSEDVAFTVPANPGAFGILTSYIALGVTHILEGVDHLLFVFALLLLIRSRSRLFWAITAFTLAHSITLGAATLGLLNLPSPPVEAVIALSIVFLAYELYLAPGDRDQVTQRFPWIVSFAFGLVHGLGFAGALREIGLPQDDIPLALLSFNIGVELGQILFIATVLTIGFAAQRLVPQIQNQAVALTREASYGTGSLAAFWVIERVASF